MLRKYHASRSTIESDDYSRHYLLLEKPPPRCSLFTLVRTSEQSGHRPRSDRLPLWWPWRASGALHRVADREFPDSVFCVLVEALSRALFEVLCRTHTLFLYAAAGNNSTVSTVTVTDQ